MTTTPEALLATENHQLEKLNEIVLRSIEEEKILTQRLYDFEEKNISFKNKAADSVAGFVGNWTFIFLFSSVIVIWIILNLVWLKAGFDPYPFILLNLFLSTIAALQAPVILMSQNSKEEKDRERAVNDYLINLKAEIEVRNLHEKIDLLISEQMKTLFEIQRLQMQMMNEIREALNPEK